ncbi:MULTISPECIES: FecR domain-containing protein [unclassified Halomonas]|uniref:FecR domain-containing protein n=1 Tax=unclassified Halomonas TaxID=2609666 RepID=UPI000990471C|nr:MULTISPECIES: FecR domain-containing protein [unclassified Halomonas]AQU83915.1 hypothetical protein B2G49_15795 [Halomonas sp. 'Soap Lake \
MNQQILETAVTWYVRLNADPADEATQKAWRRWLNENPLHMEAWARVERLQQRLGNLPADTAIYTLNGAQAQRRALLRSVGMLMMLGTGGWVTTTQLKDSALLADLRTAPGQRQALTLEDGSQLHLNTRTAVDLRFTPNERRVHVHSGEILIETANDPLGRPFIISTPVGHIQALGTRFSVRYENNQCQVMVYRHAVAITPKTTPMSMPSRQLSEGYSALFTQDNVTTPARLSGGEDAWLNGMLSIVDWRLERVASELARYRRGIVSCDPAVADLRVSGALKLDDTDQAFSALASSLPIDVRYLTRYWVRIAAA